MPRRPIPALLILVALVAGPRLVAATEDDEQARAGAALTHAIPALRAAAVTAIGDRGAVEEAPALLRAMGDGTPEVREAAVGALRRCLPLPEGAGDAVRALILRLEDQAASVRRAAVDALAATDGTDRRVAAALVLRLADSSQDVRVAALEALAELADGRAGGAALRALSDPSTEVRLAAIRAVSTLRPAGAAATLSTLAKRPTEPHFEEALLGLGRLAGSGDALAAEALLAALETPRLRPAAAEAVLLAGPAMLPALLARSPRDPLLDALRRGAADPAPRAGDGAPSPPLRSFDEAARAKLVAALGHAEERVRAAAAWALGKAGEGTSTTVGPALLRAARDPAPSVRVNAIAALAYLGRPPPEGSLDDPSPLVRVAAILSAPPRDRLRLERLARHSPQPALRAAALRRLSLVGQAEIAARIAARDPSPLCRRALAPTSLRPPAATTWLRATLLVDGRPAPRTVAALLLGDGTPVVTWTDDSSQVVEAQAPQGEAELLEVGVGPLLGPGRPR